MFPLLARAPPPTILAENGFQNRANEPVKFLIISRRIQPSRYISENKPVTYAIPLCY